MAKSIFKNPEFKRNLWLELSTLRLIVLPAILAILVFLSYIGAWSLEDFYRNLFESSFWGAALFAIYGIWRASSSVIEEVNQKTWDVQKMTPLSAWKMSLGKLFGATAFAWYGIGLCVLLQIISMVLIQSSFSSIYFSYTDIYPMYAYVPYMGDDTNLGLGLLAIFANLLMVVALQASAMMFSLLSLRNDSSTGKKGALIFCVMSVVLYFSSVNMVSETFDFNTETTSWYSLSMNPLGIYLLTSIFAVFWSLVGMIRAMRAELKFKVYPWVWILFILDLYGFIFGFYIPGNSIEIQNALLMCFTVTIGIFYGLLFIEKKPVVFFRGLGEAFKGGSKKLFQNMPLWMVTFGLSILFTGMMFVISAGHFFESGYIFGMIPPASNWIAVLFALIRDLGIALFFTFTLSKRSEFATFLSFFVGYVLFTAILSGTGAYELMGIFYPFAPKAPLISVISFSIQALVVWILTLRAYRNSLSRLEANS